MKNIVNLNEIPNEYFGLFKLEVFENRILSYNYKKIISISKELIVLSYCKIIGNNLKVKELRKDELVIDGKIKEIKLEKYANI